MGCRVWLACNATPLMLRLALAATFLWAGYGKLAYNDPVSGEEAAILANLGVIKVTASAPIPAPVEVPIEDPAPAQPEGERPAEPEPAAPEGVQRGFIGEMTVIAVRADQAAPPTMPPTTRQYSAEDFPTPVMVPRLYHIASMLHRASHPEEPSKQLWPTQLGDARTIVVLSWAAAITETAGGALVLFGFLTRLAALGLASTMLAAMLLTTIGPAAVSGTGFMGFLPPPNLSDPARWGEAWTPMLFQFTLLCSSIGLVLTGAGALSLDRLIFGGVGHPPSKPASPKSA